MERIRDRLRAKTRISPRKRCIPTTRTVIQSRIAIIVRIIPMKRKSSDGAVVVEVVSENSQKSEDILSAQHNIDEAGQEVFIGEALQTWRHGICKESCQEEGLHLPK